MDREQEHRPELNWKKWNYSLYKSVSKVKLFIFKNDTQSQSKICPSWCKLHLPPCIKFLSVWLWLVYDIKENGLNINLQMSPRLEGVTPICKLCCSSFQLLGSTRCRYPSNILERFRWNIEKLAASTEKSYLFSVLKNASFLFSILNKI